MCNKLSIFQSTRPSRASTLYNDRLHSWHRISIHKALAGLDDAKAENIVTSYNFNPQGPRGPRLLDRKSYLLSKQFQSTRPSRASTRNRKLAFPGELEFQSTRPSRASTARKAIVTPGSRFQSTRPSRASTLEYVKVGWNKFISIHKALAGLDRAGCRIQVVYCKYFNPQGPRGPRHYSNKYRIIPRIFQSTRPSRASTTHGCG